MNDIGFLYAILVPNIITRTVRVTIDSANHPITYKRDDFLKLVSDFGFYEIKPQIITALYKTQSVLWEVKENKLRTLTFKTETDSLLQDLLDVKQESENYVEDLPITEKFSRSKINIDNPDNPIVSLF